MKIDPTAAARVLLLNCADVGRVRIAKHKRQADGGIAARACAQAAAEQGQINTAGAQQPPAASPPHDAAAVASSASRPGIHEDAVAILKVWRRSRRCG